MYFYIINVGMEKIYKLLLFSLIGLFSSHYASSQDWHLADSVVEQFLNAKVKNRYEYFSPIHTKYLFRSWGKNTAKQIEYILQKLRPQIGIEEYIKTTSLLVSGIAVHEKQLAKAEMFYEKTLAEPFADPCYEVMRTTEIYQLYIQAKNYKKAEKSLINAIFKAKNYKCHALLIDYSLLHAAAVGQNVSREKAMILLLETVELAKKLGVNAEKQAEVWNQLGNMNYGIKNYARAEKYWRKSFMLYFNSLKISTELVGCMNNIALAMRKQSNISEALASYDSALRYAMNQKDTAWIGIIAGNMGDIYAEQGNYEKAIPLLQKNVKYNFLTSQWDDLVVSYPKLAQCFIKIRQFDKAKDYLDSLDWWLGEAEKKNYPYGTIYELQIKVAKNSAWAEWYAAQGKYAEAYQFQNEYIKTYKEHEQLTNQGNLNRIQTELEVERKEKENLLLKQQTEEDQEEIRKQRILNMVVVSFLVFFVGVAIIFYRMMKQRQHLNDQLSAQKEEIHSQKEALHQQNAQLEQLNSTKNRLFAIISHDLRSPINNLRGVLEIMDMDLPKEQQKQILQDTARLMDNTFQTLENLLNWAKWQMGGVHYFPQKVDIEYVTYQICSLFSQTADLKNISLENQVLTETFVWADRDHVELILRNLVGNALKFTPEGGKVWIKSEKIENIAGEFVQVCVSDEGVGISEEGLLELFDPQKIRSTRGTAGEKGTGLGLVMCKEFVEQNGGTLQARSKLGEGTVFCFILPQKNKELQTKYS